MNLAKLTLMFLLLGTVSTASRGDELDEVAGAGPVKGLVVRIDDVTKEEKVFLNKSLNGQQIKDESARESFLDQLGDAEEVKGVTTIKSAEMRELDEVPATGAYYWYRPYYQYGTPDYSSYYNYNCHNFYYYSPYNNYSYSWGYYSHYRGHHWNFYW